MRRAFALGATADARFGDPPTRWHPVGLIGRAAAALRPLAPPDAAARTRFGLAVALRLPLAGALAALAAGDLDAARALCGTHLVSRDMRELDASEVASATIESVAENLSDGVVAPWLAFALAGAPGAAAYRVANTMDALWGYRTADLDALGRAAARLDEALNLLPARLTALTIVLAAATPAYGARCSARGAFATWRADAGLTASPNAGHPMAAMAGALGVTLAKRGAYTLGAGQRTPSAADIGLAVWLARGAAALTGAGVLGALLAAGAARSVCCS